MSKDLTLTASNVSARGASKNQVEVELDNVQSTEVLDQFTLEEVIDHFSWSEILDTIGIAKCKEHFDLVEITEADK